MSIFIKTKLQKLCSEFFSLIFIPNNGKTFFELKFKKIYIFIFLFIFLSASIYSIIMTDTATSLHSVLATKIEHAITLEIDTQKQKVRINNLEKEFEKIDDRIIYLSKLDHNIRSMVGLDDSIDPIAEVNRGSTQFKTLLPTVKQVEEAQNINSQLDGKIEEMNMLIQEVEDRLEYLDCYPDRRPTFGRTTSKFGYRIHPISKRRDFHTGIDIANSYGTPVYAAGNGKVIYAAYKSGYGKTLMIDHGYGYVTVYAHNSTLLVDIGDRVSKGDKIAKTGRTGSTTGNHLHFEVKKYGTVINPMKTLK